MRRWVALSALVLAAGCKPPPAAQQEQDFQRLLELWFNNLNNDAELAKIAARDWARPDAKGQRVLPETPLPAGRQFNTYTWYPNGAILTDIECPRCKTRHMIVTYHGSRVLCSSCGSRDKSEKDASTPLIRPDLSPSDLQTLFKDRFKPMFDRVGDRSERPKECVALIRFVRRLWTLDDRGKVDISAKAQEKGTTVEPKWVEGGYHRPDMTFVSTTAFYYDGTISQLDLGHVRRFLQNADERIDWKTARLGPAIAIEDAVRPWTQPRTLDSPNVRQY